MLLDHSAKCQAGSGFWNGRLKVEGTGKLNNLSIDEIALDLSGPMIEQAKKRFTQGKTSP